MDLNLELKRYGVEFVCFLLKNIEKNWLEKINSIILFGSVTQNRAGKDSDIDLFIDLGIPPSRIKQFRSKIIRIREDFLLSREALTFKAKGIYNELNVIVGNLSKWKEMKQSISSSGIVLYGHYKEGFKRKGLKHFMIFYWEAVGGKRGAFLNKLYGYTIKRKKYSGIIQRFSGKKIGKSAALIPAEHSQKFIKILEN